jgi:hypothetical protein
VETQKIFNIVNKESIMKKSMKKYVIYVLIALFSLALYACNGGGGGNNDNQTGSIGSGSDEDVINGIIVPPVPDPIIDSESVAGVDSNNNVVRDKVERRIATEFGLDVEFYEQAMAYAIAEQAAILDPTEENIEAYTDLFRCVDDDVLSDAFGEIDDVTTDTGERGNAYREAFAGVTVNYEGC